jgi:hypothetical protein
MTRRFNITGTCIPGQHYMADIPGKLDRVIEMVANGDYFIINRPHQYGKTTMMYLLEQRLKKKKNYLVLPVTFEGIAAETYEKQELFTGIFLGQLYQCCKFKQENQLVQLIDQARQTISDLGLLDTFLSEMVLGARRKVVLMIDEVDKAGNNQVFLDFLGMLRKKYLKQKEGRDHSFHSVILAGIHDIKTLKTRMRPDQEAQYNSPWNIAVNFKVDLTLSPEEISSMLEDYESEQKIPIDIPFFADSLFYYTSGHPFLVSSLCKIIDEEILPGKNRRRWEPEDLLEAVRFSLMEDNTNFDSLIKNLENNPKLYEFVYQVIMNGSEFSYNSRNPLIHFGTMYGILKKDRGKTRVHNRIYEQLIYDYMSSKLETSSGFPPPVTAGYIEKYGALNIEKIIRKFQEFMKEQYSKKDKDFLERNGRLLFLAFIRPIINGVGFDFKEVQVSEEKRLDIVITYENKKYIVELKIWRGETYHQTGIDQLCDYLDRQNECVGYLLIYDLRKETGRTGEWEKIERKGKKIYAAWI